jgi:voltage-gated potassium channel
MAFVARPPGGESLGGQPVFTLILKRLRGPFVAVCLLAAASTIGYVMVAGYGWIDAVYMTVITLGTIGYGEVKPLDTSGRMLTVAVIIAGFSTFVYAASVLTNFFTSGDAARHMYERRARKMQETLRAHVIVVGFGRVGQAVVRALNQLDQGCAVVDMNPNLREAVEMSGAVHVVGDATNEADLRRAGIERAAAFVAAADQDAANLVVVLTARAVRPDLRIISRVNEASWLTRIKNAGADVAQSPYDSYGSSLAAAALSPSVLDLHDLPLLGLGTEEIEIDGQSGLAGHSIPELTNAHPGVYIVGLRRARRLHRWHEVTDAIQAGDVLVALGTPAHLRALADLAAADTQRDSSRP